MALPVFPADVDVAAILFEDADGRTLSSTGFSSVAEPIELGEEIEGATNVRLVAYRRADLIAIGATEADLAASPVRRAGEGDSRLPPPSFVATGLVVDGAARLAADDEVVELTVGWLPDCPMLVPEPTPLFDVDCVDRYCDARVEQKGCRIEVSAIGCATDVFFGDVDGQGDVTWGEAGDLGTCTAAPPLDGQQLAMTCDSEIFGTCRAAIYTESQDVVGDTVDVSIVDVQPLPSIKIGRPHPGFLGAMLVLPDRVWSFDFDGENRWVCESGAKGRASRVDLESVSVTNRVDVPPCPEVAYYDETDDEILLLVDRLTPRVQIYDADMQLMREAPLPLTATATGAHLHDVSMSLDRSQVIVVLEERPSKDVYVLALDRTDLSLTARSEEMFEDTTIDVFEFPRDQLSVFNHRNGEIVALDPATLASGRRSSLAAACLNAGFAMGFTWNEATGRHAFTYREPRAVVWHIDEALEACRPARFFERAASLGGITSLGGSHRLAVGATEPIGTNRAAYLAVVDLQRSHFIPGAKRVGTGQISEVIEDRVGRVWLSLPWSGHVVRAELR